MNLTEDNINGVFIHPCIRSYRVGLFNELQNHFTLDVIESGYPSSGVFVKKDRADAISDLKFKPIQQTLKRVFNFDSSVFKSLNKKYDFIIFSSFISFPFLLLVVIAKLMGKKVFVFDELWEYPTTFKYKMMKYLFKILVNLFVDGFILAGTKSFNFSEGFFSSDIKRTIAFNTSSNYSVKYNEEKRNDSILYLGRIVPIKALDKIISILPKLEQNLVVVGGADESYKTKCIELAKKLNVLERIEFIGECKKEDTYKYYSNYDVFCLPSKFMKNQSQQLESWGFTVNEALEMGCKVLVSDNVGSSYDLIENGFNGFIFKSDDLDDFERKAKLIKEIDTPPRDIRERLTEKCNYKVNAEEISALIRSFNYN